MSPLLLLSIFLGKHTLSFCSLTIPSFAGYNDWCPCQQWCLEKNGADFSESEF
jgi:hypothetical protein